MRRSYRFVLFATCLTACSVLLFAGCGGDSNEQAGQTEPTTSGAAGDATTGETDTTEETATEDGTTTEESEAGLTMVEWTQVTGDVSKKDLRNMFGAPEDVENGCLVYEGEQEFKFCFNDQGQLIRKVAGDFSQIVQPG